MRIDSLSAPAMVTWQLTKDCNLACLHCCTDSAPGRALPDEMTREEAIEACASIIEAQVPYVMIVGGEPTIVPHFFEVAETLGRAGVLLKIETNGQTFGKAEAERLAALPVRSLQISIDGATAQTYAKMRPNGTLDKAVSACRAAAAAGLPLEITFAPTKINIGEAEDVINLALELGAFRFNTGKLMKLGTAVRLWERLEPSSDEYDNFYRLLLRKEKELEGKLELCFRPFSLEEEMAVRETEPSATLLVLPNGKVKLAAPMPDACADLKTQSLPEAWEAYREGWRARQGILPAVV
jgi:MoaA/NifB/PqqE/SkfB family radical SAM enzyme